MQYKIEGTPLPVVICTLTRGETVITEKGGMSWMSDGIDMETNAGGGLGKVFGRMLSGESIFMNKYTCNESSGMIAFASSFPGSIIPFQISQSNTIIVQKTAFLAAESGVELSVSFNRKLGSGLFGGEGFIMQKLTGAGTAFVEIDGNVIEYELSAGQKIIVDTGHLAAMTEGISMDIKMVKGITNKLFGGEGFFNTILTGPGKIWLQSMPAVNLAASLMNFTPTK